MAAATKVMLVVLLAMAIDVTANDPDMLQDVCVADFNSAILVNGFTCKDISKVTPEDFSSAKLAQPGDTNNRLGSVVTAANVQNVPGLNTLGVSMARIDYAPGGLNPPHVHPRATEMIFVLTGELNVGFITTGNKLISKVVKSGEVFLFPRGLVHFQKNIGSELASVIVGFNSQLPGTQQVAASLFTSTPPVSNDVFGLTFNINGKQVEKIRAGLTPRT